MTSPLCVLVGNVVCVEFVFVVSSALSSHEAQGLYGSVFPTELQERAETVFIVCSRLKLLVSEQV